MPAGFANVPKRYLPLKLLDYQAAQEAFDNNAADMKEGFATHGRVAIISSSFCSGQLTHILTTIVPGSFDRWIRVSKQPLQVKLAALEKWADGRALNKRGLLAPDDRDSDDSEE